MQSVFKEVMLSRLLFSEGKHDVKFEFYDSYSGVDIGQVICKNIFSFNFNTAFVPNEESFPCFVLDVAIEQLIKEEVVEQFKKSNYSYTDGGQPVIPQSEQYWIFKIQGGPLDIKIICDKIETTKFNEDK
ncbi:hypothetical protein [Clostridium sp. UBA4548]|uniref:hypothetical protein n=1 Tax=Clostridium sp. UBA4548 TaxID=1946361 RepID=UPI0025B9FCE5|nr:hypothetical protein [Clostridium sp. UBA4548]